VIIDKDSPEHPYVQLANWLRDSIRRGRIGPRLPSIKELTEQSGLSPATVKRAVKLLVDEKMVRTVRGRGTFVVSRR